jgi:glycosyltransferase involved in cell wall biosynthesis
VSRAGQANGQRIDRELQRQRLLFGHCAAEEIDASGMKILTSHYLSDPQHGAARIFGEMCRALGARGHEVIEHRSDPTPAASLASAAARPRRFQAGRNALWFAKALARNRAMLRTDRAALERVRPELVLARQDAYCFSMALAASRLEVPLVTFADAPVAYETRTYGSRSGRWHPPGLVEAIERWTLKRSRAVVTVSTPSAELLSRYGVDCPIHVAPNGVDPDRFPELSDRERSVLRRSLNLTAPRIAGFSGTFRVFHGLDHLKRVIQALGPRPDTEWLLVGDGPEAPALRDALRDRTDVVFTGFLPREDLGRVLPLIDVAVASQPPHTGPYHFCPMRVLECAAAGCAVVASNMGDIPRLLDDARVGIVLADAGVDAWRAAIEALLDDPRRSAELGREARSWMMTHYTWAHTAERVELALYEALAAPSTTAGRHG